MPQVIVNLSLFPFSSSFFSHFVILYWFSQEKLPYDLAVSSQQKGCIDLLYVETRKRKQTSILDTLTKNPVREWLLFVCVIASMLDNSVPIFHSMLSLSLSLSHPACGMVADAVNAWCVCWGHGIPWSSLPKLVHVHDQHIHLFLDHPAVCHVS